MAFRWRGGKVPVGVEYYCYPSPRAQRFFIHAYSLGQARTPKGFYGHYRNRDAFLLHYIRRGEMWHRIGPTTYRVRQGSVIAMDLRQDVKYGNDRPSPADNWWVAFNGKEMPSLYAALGADEDPVFHPRNTRDFERRFTILLDTARRDTAGGEADASAALLGVLAICMAQREPRPSQSPLVESVRGCSPPVRKALNYITRFYHEPKTLKHLCSIAGRSMSAFVRQFHKEVGMPPMQYLNHYRIQQARRLLEHSECSVAEIAEMVGIPRANYFTRLFSDVVGVSPTRYRRRHAARAGNGRAATAVEPPKPFTPTTGSLS